MNEEWRLGCNDFGSRTAWIAERRLGYWIGVFLHDVSLFALLLWLLPLLFFSFL